MTRSLRFRHAMLAALFSIACGGPTSGEAPAAPPAFDLEQVRAVITQQNRAFTDAHLAGDADAVDSLFTPDARSYPPGAPAAIGLPAIHALTVEFLKADIKEFREESTAIYGNAEYVIDEGTYLLRYGEGLTERGKYVNVWKQVDGRWRIQTNIWNADPPSAE